MSGATRLARDHAQGWSRILFNRANAQYAADSSTVSVRRPLHELSDICTHASNDCYNSFAIPICRGSAPPPNQLEQQSTHVVALTL